MLHKMYAIYDRKVMTYRFPNFVRSEGAAIRSLQTAVTDLSTEIGRYPNDFELYEFGIWDDERGTSVGHEKPIFVISAQSLFLQAMKEEKKVEGGNE